MGYQVLFLSTDQPSLLYSSLKQKMDYHLLSDSTMDAAHAFGVAFHVDAATLAKMKTYGIDLEATQGTARHELPVSSSSIVAAWFAFATTTRITRSAWMRPMCWQRRKAHRKSRAAYDFNFPSAHQLVIIRQSRQRRTDKARVGRCDAARPKSPVR